jgi:hypothetical protein
MEFNEEVELVTRIALSITNPSLTKEQRVKLAEQWFGAAQLVADKWEIPVSAVLDIHDKLGETEDMFEPEEMSDEQHIFWDYVNECNQFDHMEGMD